MSAKKGDRVRLIYTSDQYTKLKPGTVGTVAMVDSLGTVHVNWDTGSTLGLVPGEDEWLVFPEEKHDWEPGEVRHPMHTDPLCYHCGHAKNDYAVHLA